MIRPTTPSRTPLPPRVHRGEVWQLGAHRLICGDVRDPAVLAALMAGEQARLVFTDPPLQRSRSTGMPAAWAASNTASSPWPLGR